MMPVARPLIIEPPDTPTMVLRPKTATAKYSAGPKRSASRDSGSAAISSTTRLRKMPRNAPMALRPSASPARPWRASGWPSQVIAIDAGVPGVLSRMAGTPPLKIADTSRPSSIAIA